MKAMLHSLESNDHISSDALRANSISERAGASSGWFTVEVGPEASEAGGEFFQVLVVAASEASNLRQKGHRARYVVVREFTPEVIEEDLRRHVSGISGASWNELRESLRKSMWWEREPMPGRKTGRTRRYRQPR